MNLALTVPMCTNEMAQNYHSKKQKTVYKSQHPRVVCTYYIYLKNF